MTEQLALFHCSHPFDSGRSPTAPPFLEGWVNLILSSCCLALTSLVAGCQTLPSVAAVPSRDQFVHHQLVIHSDFVVPKRHRLFDELAKRRADIQEQLNLPMSDEPIHIYLFQDADLFRKYLLGAHPTLSDRRAVFVQTDTQLSVYAFWGDRVAEDLRHEVSHGYLHAQVPKIQLWLDEGLAEYFELPREASTINRPHVHRLASEFRAGHWTPNLERLEQFEEAETFGQTQYAEAWLWVHFLLEHSEKTKSILQDFVLGEQDVTDGRQLLSAILTGESNSIQVDLIEHLMKLVEQEPKPVSNPTL